MSKNICCYSGGVQSALTALNVAVKYGNENLILLNHNISPSKEDESIKQFKQDVADYIGVSITYANCLGIIEPERIPNQFQVCMIAKAFKLINGQELCTNRLKTAPFSNWLSANATGEDVVYYGFSGKELNRIERRKRIMSAMGYQTDYPLALWDNLTITSVEQVGIKLPEHYKTFRHGNCLGCLKAGLQHWYCIYCLHPDIYQEGIEAEKYIGYSIHREGYLIDFVNRFERMKQAGIIPTEIVSSQKFWANVRKKTGIRITVNTDEIPCDCAV